MRMGQLSLRPMERLCAIGVLKAASAARWCFSPRRSPQSNSCTTRYNTAHENEPQWVGTNAEKSPNSLLLQRGRAVGPGILPLIGIFISVAEDCESPLAVFPQRVST